MYNLGFFFFLCLKKQKVTHNGLKLRLFFILNHPRDIAIGSGRVNYKRLTLTDTNDKLCTHRVGKTMFKALESNQKWEAMKGI